MTLTRLGLLISFVVLLDLSTARGGVLLSAAYSLSANAFDPTVQPTGASELAVGGDTFVPLVEVEGGALHFEGHAQAERGGSTASLHGTARASIGSIGVSIVGGVHGHTGGTGGEGQAKVNSLFAGWSDSAIVRARGKSNGQALIFNSFLDIDGDMTASVSGTDRFNRPAGNAFAFLEITDSSPDYSLPTAPYPGGTWARIIENPGGNQHVLDEVPGAIRLQFVMRVGQPFTYSFNIHLNQNSSLRAFDGGTAILTADFGNSLKWGGVESVTDMEGNLIPREDWSIESESGFDYSRSFEAQVPEPASVALFGLGLCLGLGRAANLRRSA